MAPVGRAIGNIIGIDTSTDIDPGNLRRKSIGLKEKISKFEGTEEQQAQALKLFEQTKGGDPNRVQAFAELEALTGETEKAFSIKRGIATQRLAGKKSLLETLRTPQQKSILG